MGRIIGIDYGSKRTGLAVTDSLQIIAGALDTIHSKDLIQYLKDYDAKESIEAFVLGMPLNLDSTATHNTETVVIFKKQLEKAFPEKPIHLIDERFTSKMALDAMIAGGMKKKDRQNKGNIDKVSATILLQTYLERKQNLS